MPSHKLRYAEHAPAWLEPVGPESLHLTLTCDRCDASAARVVAALPQRDELTRAVYAVLVDLEQVPCRRAVQAPDGSVVAA